MADRCILCNKSSVFYFIDVEDQVKIVCKNCVTSREIIQRGNDYFFLVQFYGKPKNYHEVTNTILEQLNRPILEARQDAQKGNEY